MEVFLRNPHIQIDQVHCMIDIHVYVSTVPLSDVNSRFFSAIPLSSFSLKMSRFFCIFRLRTNALFSVKWDSDDSLGNQFPVLGKANSLCKSVKKCVFCLFVKLQLSSRRVRDRITGYRSSGKIRVASRHCNTAPLAPLAVKKYTNSSFLRFFVR